MDSDELSNRFQHHAPSPKKMTQHGDVRAHALALAIVLNELLPEGREKSKAMTKLEETMFWANAALSRVP